MAAVGRVRTGITEWVYRAAGGLLRCRPGRGVEGGSGDQLFPRDQPQRDRCHAGGDDATQLDTAVRAECHADRHARQAEIASPQRELLKGGEGSRAWLIELDRQQQLVRLDGGCQVELEEVVGVDLPPAA